MASRRTPEGTVKTGAAAGGLARAAGGSSSRLGRDSSSKLDLYNAQGWIYYRA